MKKVIFILTMISWQNTEDDSHNDYLDAYVEFSIKNDVNEDLLNPNNVNSIDTSKINIYYIKDGIKTRYYKSNYTNPKGYLIFEHANEFRIRIFTGHSSDKNTTIIEWFENKVDSIEVLYEKASNSVYRKDVWLKWRACMGNRR
jgi:hypothetical protein